MHKILITGTFSSLNKGDESRVRCMVGNMQKIVPCTCFTLLSYDPMSDHEIYAGSDIKVMERPWHKEASFNFLENLYRYAGALLMVLNCSLAGVLAHAKLPLKKGLSQYDMVIDLSGESLSDYFGQKELLYCLYSIFLALLMKKPTVICAQSIGPFKNKFTKLLAKSILKKVNLITVRDSESLNYLHKYSINGPNIFLTADPSFLEHARYETVDKILSKEGIARDGKPLIGISISYGSYIERISKRRTELIKIISRVISNLQDRLDAKIMLVPHVLIPMYTRANEDDRLILEMIYRLSRKKDKISLIKGNYRPEELKALIGQCDLFISSRMHPIIHAVSMGIPPVAIAHSHKMLSLMRELGLKKYVFTSTNLTFNKLMTGINDAWNNKDRIEEGIKPKIRELKRRAWLNVKLVTDLLLTYSNAN